ncbi:unnamed protein product [Allacma fusca]|uniref:Iron-binding zinc finger CDGSH type domain-containing protein n=1 Tax=Allacma fusca TaxID=39272 RepID=A0A8J2PYK6_9HEXA|nr:unnamed protein product [Allacma fusca]
MLLYRSGSTLLLKKCLISPSQKFVQPFEAASMRQKVTTQVPYEKLDIYTQKAVNQPGKGKIYDKKPFKFFCEKGKTYLWCTCGYSHSQPFCDGHHKNPHFRIKMKPLIFLCPESKEYWFCNCKQTKQRPFCDGTHRLPEIQAAVKS